jgi:hypothetical protein
LFARGRLKSEPVGTVNEMKFSRLMRRPALLAALILSLLLAFQRPSMAVPPGQEMLPEQSAAKAKQVLQQVITALGGQAFLNVRDTECEGRVAQFGSNNELMGFTMFRDLWVLPDKNRTEYIAKSHNTITTFLLGADDLSITHGGMMVTIFDGAHGWQLDKGGVSDEPEDTIATFNEQVKSGLNNMLRARMNEPGVEAQYAGTDLIDMKEAEWIDFTDRDHRDLRLAVDKNTHVPLRWVVATRDPETRERTEVTISYAQYQTFDGVKTPLNLVGSRNDRNTSQTFLTGCKYNSDLASQLFTRASLEQRAAEVSKKGYKDSKDTQ